MPTANPYCPSQDKTYAPCVFAGRTDAYRHLHQHLADETAPHAAVFVGERHIGKSAFLWHFGAFFDPRRIGVYVPLVDLDLQTENALWDGLASAVYQMLARMDLTLHRIPDHPDTDEDAPDARTWFAEAFLPEVFTTIRPHRELVLLLDDADVLLDALDAGHIPADTPEFLSTLLTDNAQLTLALTVDVANELNLDRLRPLADPTHVYRLGYLTAESTQQLMDVSDSVALNPDATATVQRVTGGHPLLVQWLGYLLHEQYTPADDDTPPDPRRAVGAEDVKAQVPALLTRAHALLHAQWQRLTRNERLVLDAVSNQLYRNPLQPVTPAAVERWLVETDYPLGETAVRAALRGLEYHRMVYHEGEGVRLCVGLMQTWLRQNAQMDDERLQRLPRRAWLIAAVVVLAAAAVAWGVLTQVPPPDAPPPDAAPTVTLAEPSG